MSHFFFFFYFTFTHGPPTLTHIYPFSLFSKHFPFLFSLFFFLFSYFSFFSQGKGSNQYQNKTHKILINQYHWWWEGQIWVAQVFVSNLSHARRISKIWSNPSLCQSLHCKISLIWFQAFCRHWICIWFDFEFGLLVFSWWFNFELIFYGFWVD